LIPVSHDLRNRLSPHAFEVDVALRLGAPPQTPQPVSLDPSAGAWALALGAAYIGLFWCARAIYARGGVRMTTRHLATIGLALTAFVAIQRATAPRLLYWYWHPISPEAQPYGPFLNRNSLACWLAMTIPLAIGYAMARAQSRRSGTSTVSTIDETQIWLVGTAFLMMGGLLGSLSRGGILGGAVGLAALLLFSAARARRNTSFLWAAMGVVLMIGLASFYANLGALVSRLNETTELGEWGRRVIWRDTWSIFEDFRLTGIGAGAFARAMLAYQRASRQFFFNDAHNEYLQLLVEGGVIGGAFAAAALLAGATLAAIRLHTDRSSIYWLRAGAIGGMIAVAVQSIWDTGLRMPANGALFAVLAAIAMHHAPTAAGSRDGGASIGHDPGLSE